MTTALNPDRDFLLRHIGFDKTMVRAEGVHLFDEHGHAYLDFLAQYGAVPFGHSADPAWRAIDGCRGEPCMVQPFHTQGAKDLAQALVGLEPAFGFAHAVFCNSGAEAVEAALKMARAATGRQLVVSLRLGFHGKTSGALAVTGNPVYSEPFGIDTRHSIKVDADDLAQLEAAFAAQPVAAFIFETVLGEGGMRPLCHDFVRRAAALCRQHGAMLIADEVQTGMGRLGEFFSVRRIEGVRPDILCLAKALGGGLLPIGAVLATGRAWSEAFGLHHSATFANNQLACRVALSTLATLAADDRALMRHVDEVGAYLGARLDELVEGHADVFPQHCGAGLMHSLRIAPFDGAESYFLAHASAQGYVAPLICGYLVNVERIVVAPLFNRPDLLRLEPSLSIERGHVDRLLEALVTCAGLVRQRRFSSLLSFLIGRRPQELAYSEPAVASAPLAARIPAEPGERRGRFAFLIHPTSAEDLIDIMPRAIIDLAPPDRQAFQRWMQSWFERRYEPAPVFHAERIASRQGGHVEGWLIACPLPPERMLRLGRSARERLLRQYVDCARGLGVDIVGLGAFTSIISRGGTDLLDLGVPLTTGNSFTAIASAESLCEALRVAAPHLVRPRLAVVGAGGSVGRLAALHLSTRHDELVLAGNAANPEAAAQLRPIVGEIYLQGLRQMRRGVQAGMAGFLGRHCAAPLMNWGRCEELAARGEACALVQIADHVEASLDRPPPVRVTLDVEAALRDAHGVLSATSQGASFIEPAWLRRGAVVCDAARPADLKRIVHAERPDLLVFEGGIVRFVQPYRFGRANILGFDERLNLACLSETVALAMQRHPRSCSLGNRIPYDEALAIHRLALEHGFETCVARVEGEIDLDAWARRAHGLAGAAS